MPIPLHKPIITVFSHIERAFIWWRHAHGVRLVIRRSRCTVSSPPVTWCATGVLGRVPRSHDVRLVIRRSRCTRTSPPVTWCATGVLGRVPRSHGVRLVIRRSRCTRTSPPVTWCATGVLGESPGHMMCDS